MNRNIVFAHLEREEKRVHFFDVPARFHISPSPLHNYLPSLTAEYNPSRKLLAQLQALTDFSRRLAFTMLH